MGRSWRALLPLLTWISKTTGARGLGSLAAVAAAATSAACWSSAMDIVAKDPAGNTLPVLMLLRAKSEVFWA